MINSNYYVLNEEVEAVVVTEAYLGSLPRMGGNPQRYKDKAEVVGPRGEKSYAALDDYVVKVGDNFLVVPKTIFRAMFAQVSDTQPVVPESPPDASDPNESTPAGDQQTEATEPTPTPEAPSAPVSEPTSEELVDDLPEVSTPPLESASL